MKALQINRGIKRQTTQPAYPAANLWPEPGLKEKSSPAASRQRNDLIHRWMKTREIGKARIHTPGQLHLRQCAADIRDHIKGLHNVAKRRGSNQQ
jgi:hypothetical protein